MEIIGICFRYRCRLYDEKVLVTVHIWLIDMVKIGKFQKKSMYTIGDFDLLFVRLSSLYTFVVFPLVFGVFSKSSIEMMVQSGGNKA